MYFLLSVVDGEVLDSVIVEEVVVFGLSANLTKTIYTVCSTDLLAQNHLLHEAFSGDAHAKISGSKTLPTGQC